MKKDGVKDREENGEELEERENGEELEESENEEGS